MAFLVTNYWFVKIEKKGEVLGFQDDGYVRAENRKSALWETTFLNFWDSFRDFSLNFGQFSPIFFRFFPNFGWFSPNFSRNICKSWSFEMETFDFHDFGTLSETMLWICTPLRDFWGMKQGTLIARTYPIPILPKCTPEVISHKKS